MSGPVRQTDDKLSAEKLAELARVVARLHRPLLPVFLWCLCRSKSAREACQELEPSNLQITAIKSHPTGERLVASVSGASWRWLRRRREEKKQAGGRDR